MGIGLGVRRIHFATPRRCSLRLALVATLLPSAGLKFFFEPHNRQLYEMIGRDLGWEKQIDLLIAEELAVAKKGSSSSSGGGGGSSSSAGSGANSGRTSSGSPRLATTPKGP
jgi:hypothetical protein